MNGGKSAAPQFPPTQMGSLSLQAEQRKELEITQVGVEWAW